MTDEIDLLAQLVQFCDDMPADARESYLRRTHNYLWDRFVDQPKRDAKKESEDP